MKIDVNAFLNRLNTHTVFGVGLGTAMVSLATIVFGPIIEQATFTHAPLLAAAVTPMINVAIVAAQGALPPAIIAAAYGRPHNVPAGPVAGDQPSPPTLAATAPQEAK